MWEKHLTKYLEEVYMRKPPQGVSWRCICEKTISGLCQGKPCSKGWMQVNVEVLERSLSWRWLLQSSHDDGQILLVARRPNGILLVAIKPGQILLVAPLSRTKWDTWSSRGRPLCHSLEQYRWNHVYKNLLCLVVTRACSRLNENTPNSERRPLIAVKIYNIQHFLSFFKIISFLSFFLFFHLKQYLYSLVLRKYEYLYKRLAIIEADNIFKETKCLKPCTYKDYRFSFTSQISWTIKK